MIITLCKLESTKENRIDNKTSDKFKRAHNTSKAVRMKSKEVKN